MASTYSGRWRVVTYLTPAYGEKVEQRAANNGESVSRFIERLVTAGIDEEDQRASVAS